MTYDPRNSTLARYLQVRSALVREKFGLFAAALYLREWRVPIELAREWLLKGE